MSRFFGLFGSKKKAAEPAEDRSPPPELAPPAPAEIEAAEIEAEIKADSAPEPAESVPSPIPAATPQQPQPEPESSHEPTVPAKQGWFSRLKNGLAKTSNKLTQGLGDLFTKRRLDDEALEDLQDLLITSDLGVGMAERMVARMSKTRFGQDVDAAEIKTALAEEVTAILTPVAQPLTITPSHKPHVILVVGVNGAGKTTTIGKFAKQYRDQGLSVRLAAGDTFRAAAVEQLKVWGDRTGCPVVSRETGADAAGLAYDALAEAKSHGDDVLFIDTAGRLQNKTDLMAELEKIIRVIRKQDPSAPHDVLLVLDATIGQNAHSQVEIFRSMVGVTGLILTKLDGTARGGVLVALAEKFGLPVHAIGIGEKVDDLRPFDATQFARSLVGLDDA